MKSFLDFLLGMNPIPQALYLAMVGFTLAAIAMVELALTIPAMLCGVLCLITLEVE